VKFAANWLIYLTVELDGYRLYTAIDIRI